MARVIAFNALFFVLPFAGYAAWLLLTRGRVDDSSDWPVKIIVILTASGAAIMLLALLVFVTFSGAPPGTTYVPATIEDGVVVPGYFE